MYVKSEPKSISETDAYCQFPECPKRLKIFVKATMIKHGPLLFCSTSCLTNFINKNQGYEI